MKQYLTELCKDAEKQLRQIENRHDAVLAQSKEAITYLEEMFATLKERILEHEFPNDEEEINFFKHVKPRLFSNMIYYRKLYNIEMNRPTGSNEVQTVYLKRELDRIKDFFDRNHDFYMYHRSGNLHLDHHYYRRGRPGIHVNLESFFFERDPLFSTSGDFKLAKLLANERLQVYLQDELSLAEGVDTGDYIPKRRYTWTASKTDLIELIYAFRADGCLDYGNASIAQLAAYLETAFNISLGNVNRNFSDMKIRNTPTPFLDRLKRNLLEKMGREE